MPFEWRKAVETLKASLGEEAFGRWIAPLKLASVSENEVVLEAPNPFFRDWVISHYHDKLQEVAEGRRLQLLTATTRLAESETSRAPERPVTPEPLGRTPQPKHTFDRFVVGPSNRFAHAASLAVAESPAKAYNPLFIYGGVGLGKTHLLQAIGHTMTQRASQPIKICYVSSEQFTNDLITSIQTKTTAKFRDRYRTVEALLIDDIQFIAGKESTQEEFFHTFNALYEAHKQLVLSSDRSPKDIDGLEERLVSRFEWGLITDIQPPDLETRIAILRKKAVEAGLEAPDELTTFIARQITANIRELEGALIRVAAYGRFFSKPLTVEVAQEVLRDMAREVGARITIELIQRRVAEHFHMTSDELKSARRQRSILYPRQMAMYLCRTLTEASLPEIGRAFGGRDHSTVLHAVDKISQEITQDGHRKRQLDHLTTLITTVSHQT